MERAPWYACSRTLSRGNRFYINVQQEKGKRVALVSLCDLKQRYSLQIWMVSPTYLKDNNHLVLPLDNDGHVYADVHHRDGFIDDNILDLGSVDKPRHASATQIYCFDLDANVSDHKDGF